MPEGIHTQDCTETAACKSRQKQGLFGNTPEMPLCTLLIKSHEGKGSDIDNSKITDGRYIVHDEISFLFAEK